MTVAVRRWRWRHPRVEWWGLPPAPAQAPGFFATRPTLTQAESLNRQQFAGVSGAGTGDDAFETFFRTHEREIFGYLWRVTGDEQASYDLAQETFVRAWQRFEQVRRYERPRAWLFRVATNLASNHRRGRSVRDAAASRLPSDYALTGDPSVSIAESEAVQAALEVLPVRQRAALILRVVYGLSLDELARALGSSESAAKMTLSRARERFRAHYMQEASR